MQNEHAKKPQGAKPGDEETQSSTAEPGAKPLSPETAKRGGRPEDVGTGSGKNESQT